MRAPALPPGSSRGVSRGSLLPPERGSPENWWGTHGRLAESAALVAWGYRFFFGFFLSFFIDVPLDICSLLGILKVAKTPILQSVGEDHAGSAPRRFARA